MRSVKTGATKLMAIMLVGGLMTGGLMAMTTPTQMKREATNWRQAIGVREIAASESTIPIYAPPEDLTPVHWQPAADEYAYAPNPEPWVDTISDLMPDAVDEDGHIGAERLPAEIMAARVPDPEPEDAAATSAQAAQAAASDVHAEQSVGAADAAAASPKLSETT